MKLQKGKQTFEVVGEIQAAAFKAAGWKEVKPQKAKEAAKDAEPPADQPDQAAE